MVASPFQQAAQELLDCGYNPIPLPLGEKFPPPEGFTGATGRCVHQHNLDEWLGDLVAANVAIRLPHGVIGIDIDHYGDKRGLDDIAEMENELGVLPQTWMSSAREGGAGIRLFVVPPNVVLRSSFSTAIEVIQFHHRYALVAPSLHPEGGTYRWIDHNGAEADRPPSIDDLTALPNAWLDHFISTSESRGVVPSASPQCVREFISRYSGSQRPWNLKGIRTMLENRSSGRHDTLVKVACLAAREASRGDYPAAEAIDVLRTWWNRVMTNPDRRNGRELDDAVAWAIAQAIAEPDEPSTENGSTADEYDLTDAGNAQRLIDKRGTHLRFVPAWHQWLVYQDGRWTDDHANVIVSRWALETNTEILAATDVAAASDGGKRALALFNWRKKSRSATGVRDAVNLARTMEAVYLRHEDLDSDPWLFNVRNGTIDLHTGELRAHRPEHLLHLQSGVHFDKAAQAPMWMVFLKQILPDDDVRNFVQRLLGMALVGKQLEHVLPIAIGDGANGKSTLTRVVSSVLGDYSIVVSRDLLLADKQDRHPTGRAALFRRRFAHLGELNPDSRLDEAQVKELTGGDRISARRMREDPWEFDPTHTLFVHANHRPRIEGTDHAIWRRVLLLLFDVQIPASEQNTHLADEIIENESSGVFNWLLAGLMDYLQHGLQAPEAVMAATMRYREESDTAQRFVIDVGLEIRPDGWMTAAGLKDRHSEWFGDAAIGGSEGTHYRRVLKHLEGLGAYKDRGSGGVRLWKGIRLPLDESDIETQERADEGDTSDVDNPMNA